MIKIVQSLNEPNVFCVKFIPFKSPCEPPILKKNQLAEFISSEGALYVILPYDYPAPPTFWTYTGP